MGFMKKFLCLSLWVHTSFPLEVITKYQFPLLRYFGYILPKVESPKSLQLNKLSEVCGLFTKIKFIKLKNSKIL